MYLGNWHGREKSSILPSSAIRASSAILPDRLKQHQPLLPMSRVPNLIV